MNSPSVTSIRIALLAVLLGAILLFQQTAIFAAPGATPIAVDDDRLDQPVGVAVAVNVAANDIDSDGDIDPTTVRIIDSANLSQLLTNVIVPGEGVWRVNTGNGVITFSPCTQAGQPDASCTGPFRDDPLPMEYTVADRTGQRSNPAIVTITFDPNATLPPVIQDDQANTQRGQAVTIPVLANDSDPDGTLNPRSVTIAANPAHGTALPNDDGTITYTPTGDYTGPDQFAYRVCDTDPTPKCASANVNVTVTPPGENRAPLVVNDSPPAIAHGQATVINVLANDSDPDGALNKNSVSVKTAPLHGTAVPATDGSGTIAYTPTAGYSGSDQFTYQVCDVGSPIKCGEATVFLTVLPLDNLAPTANDDQAATQQNRPVTIPVLSNDRDPEGALESGVGADV